MCQNVVKHFSTSCSATCEEGFAQSTRKTNQWSEECTDITGVDSVPAGVPMVDLEFRHVQKMLSTRDYDLLFSLTAIYCNLLFKGYCQFYLQQLYMEYQICILLVLCTTLLNFYMLSFQLYRKPRKRTLHEQNYFVIFNLGQSVYQ